MKPQRLIAITLFVLTLDMASAQGFDEIEIGESCSFFGESIPNKVTTFSSDSAAEVVIEEIVSASGLAKNFLVKAAGVPNAAATIKGGTRYILYNQNFMQNKNRETNTEWASVSIMAHEVGHHLNGHTLGSTGSRPKTELEADYYAGFILQKMGATMNESLAVFQTMGGSTASKTHPAKHDRLAAAGNGWTKACESDARCGKVKKKDTTSDGKKKDTTSDGKKKDTTSDGDCDDIYAHEKRLLQSDDVGVAERARLGKVVGADYMVYGKILPVLVEEIDKSIAISGEHIVQIVVTVRVEFRVIAVATRQVKWSSTAVSKRVIKKTGPYRDEDVEQVVDSALGEVAELIFEELTENIYPPKISKVLAANRFILNRGGTTVEKGMLFEVFDLGENIVDPYTGESLGRVESFVGLAKIVEKKPKYSIAKLETGVSIKTGMILRKYRGEETTVKQKAKPSYEDANSDGLPDYLELLNPQ